MGQIDQQWLVCVPLGINLQLVNPKVNAVNIIMINCTIGTKRELCSAKYKALWANGVPYELIKNTVTCTSHLEADAAINIHFVC